MRIFLCVVLGVMLIGAIALANTGDQEVAGHENTAVLHKGGDRNLVATGGFPAVEPNTPLSDKDITMNRKIEGYTQWKRETYGGNLPLWNWDVLVSNDHPVRDPFLFVDPATNYLYCVYAYYGTAIPCTSSVTIFYSTDDGASWNYVLDSWIDDTTTIYNTDACIDTEGDSTFIFVICNARNDQIWLFRYNITAATTDWVQITTGHVYDPGMEQIENSLAYIYFAYLIDDTEIRFRVSTNYGVTWSSPYDVYTGTSHNPDLRIIAAGNIWAYIVWDNGPVIYSKANDWQGFDGWSGIAEHTHNFRGSSDDVNAKFTAHWNCDTAWVVGEENLNNSGDWNVVWDFTLDGLAWRNDTLFPDVDLAADPARDELKPTVLVDPSPSYADRARVVYNSDTRIDYQYFSGSWAATTGINEHNADVASAPGINYVAAAGGGAIVYNSPGNVWYDYWNNSGVDEELRPVNKRHFSASSLSRGNVTIQFMLPVQERISIKAYDATGRHVGTIIDGIYSEGRHNHTWNANLATGQYFLRLRTDSGAETRSIIVVR